MKQRISSYCIVLLVLILVLFIPVLLSNKAKANNNLGADQACEGERFGLELVNGYPACCVHFDGGKTEVHICEKNFPDEHFRSYIRFVQYSAARVYGDLTIPIDKLTGITELPIGQQGHQLYMTTLKGIEFMPELESINCSGHVLTEIDFSHNPKLKSIDCAGNYLTMLDFSSNSQLLEIDCSANQLTSLDLSSNTELIKLNASNNPLTALRIEQCTNLDALDVSNTELKKIILREGTELTEFIAGEYVWLLTDGYSETFDSTMGGWPYWTYEYNEDLSLRYATEDRGWAGKTGYDYVNGEVVREKGLRSGDGSSGVIEYIRDEQGRIVHASETRTYIGEVEDVLEKKYIFDDSGRLLCIKFVYTDMDGSNENGEAELSCMYQSLNEGWEVDYQLSWIAYSSFLDRYHNASFNPDPGSWSGGRDRIIRETFDKEGRILRREWSGGDYIVWEYDNDGHLIKMERANGWATTYEYNELGQLLSVKNGDSVYTYTYGPKGQCIAEESLNDIGTSYDVYLHRSYDKYGHLVLLSGYRYGIKIHGEYTWVYLPVPGSEQPVLSYKEEEESVNLDALMGTDPTVYNNELAEVAARLSLKTYDNDGKNGDSVEGYLQYNLGFDKANIHSRNYGNDYAFTIATKEYSGDDADEILVIVAQGTTTTGEKIKDYVSKLDHNNERFYGGYAPYQVVSAFYSEIVSHDYSNPISLYSLTEQDKSYKILVTGHSLGGAVANLLSAQLTARRHIGGAIGQSDVFCYTFGAIDSIRVDSPVVVGYENIHNIYNELDTLSPTQYGRSIIGKNGIFLRNGKFGVIESFEHEYRTPEEKSNGNQLIAGVNHAMHNYLEAVLSDRVKNSTLRPGNAGFIDLANSFSVVGCPVDVDVYCDDKLVGRVVNNIVDVSATSISIFVDDDVKFIVYPDDKQYDLKLSAFDEGTMVYYTQNLTGEMQVKTISNVALAKGKSMTSQIGGNIDISEIKLYVVNDHGETLAEVLDDGTENQIENTVTVTDSTSIPSQAKEEDVEERTKQNNTLVPLIVGIVLILIGLVIFLHWRRQSHNAHRQ